MKKKGFILLSICTLFACLYGFNKPKLVTHDVTKELGEAIQIEDFIDSSSKNVEISEVSIQNELPDKVGNYSIALVYKGKNYPASLTIQDTTPPAFIDFKNELEIQPGGDVLSYFKAEDLSAVTLSIKENIDLSISGDYTIHIQATDTSNNIASKACHLVIQKTKQEEIISDQQTNSSQSLPSSSNSSSSSSQSISNNSSTASESDIPTDQTNQPESTACGYSGSIGNSGMTFNSYAQAIAYADSYLMNNLWTYSGYSTEKIGCPDIWTVSFY